MNFIIFDEKFDRKRCHGCRGSRFRECIICWFIEKVSRYASNFGVIKFFFLTYSCVHTYAQRVTYVRWLAAAVWRTLTHTHTHVETPGAAAATHTHARTHTYTHSLTRMQRHTQTNHHHTKHSRTKLYFFFC